MHIRLYRPEILFTHDLQKMLTDMVLLNGILPKKQKLRGLVMNRGIIGMSGKRLQRR